MVKEETKEEGGKYKREETFKRATAASFSLSLGLSLGLSLVAIKRERDGGRNLGRESGRPADGRTNKEYEDISWEANEEENGRG